MNNKFPAWERFIPSVGTILSQRGNKLFLLHPTTRTSDTPYHRCHLSAYLPLGVGWWFSIVHHIIGLHNLISYVAGFVHHGIKELCPVCCTPYQRDTPTPVRIAPGVALIPFLSHAAPSLGYILIRTAQTR